MAPLKINFDFISNDAIHHRFYLHRYFRSLWSNFINVCQ